MLLASLLRAAVGTLFTFAMTALGAAAVFFLRKDAPQRSQTPCLGFAAGVMTAAAVWSLLLPAIERAAALSLRPAWLPAAGGMLLGAAFLAAFDAALPHLPQKRPDGAEARANALLLTAITLHNVPEGMAVGLAFALADTPEALAAAAVLALGIGIQNCPEGAAVALPLRQAGESRRKAFRIGTLSGAVEPLFGVLVVLAAGSVLPLMPWLLGFAAGAMLFVVTGELIPRAAGLVGNAAYLFGFLLMMVLDTALA